MKKYISLTQDWVEKNGQDSLKAAVARAGERVRTGLKQSTGENVYYVAEVRKIVKPFPQLVMILDVREVE